MGRLGVLPENVSTLAEGLTRPCFDVEGILTHFSCADESEDFTQSQVRAMRPAQAVAKYQQQVMLIVLHRQIHVFNDAAAQFISVFGSEPKRSASASRVCLPV